MTSERQGTRCKYLIDTSALYPMLLSGMAFDSDECAVSSLTKYEIGNALWREYRQRKLKDPKRIAAIFSEAISGMHEMEISAISDVLVIAVGRSLTFYDASYAHIAEREGMKLVTEDADLLRKCKTAITIKDLERERLILP